MGSLKIVFEKPFGRPATNIALYTIVAALGATAVFMIPAPNDARARGPGETIAFAISGGLLCAAVLAAYFHDLFAVKHPDPLRLEAQDLALAATESARLLDRLDAARVQWISVLTVLHAGALSFAWWAANAEGQIGARIAMQAIALAFSALTLSTWVAGFSILAASQKSAHAMEAVSNNETDSPFAQFYRRVHQGSIQGFLDFLLSLGLIVVGFVWLMISLNVWSHL